METKFKYQHSTILQIIYEANKNGQINDDEKTKIKGK
jgi:hypothetical protein